MPEPEKGFVARIGTARCAVSSRVSCLGGVVDLRGHVRIDKLARRLAWMSLAIVVSTVSTAVRAETPIGGEPVTASAEPLVLEAERVRYWDLRGERWVLLEGRARVLQGGPSVLTANRAVVRVRPAPDKPQPSAIVEVYAEGQALAAGTGAAPADSLRIELATTQALRLRSAKDEGVVRLDAPPSDLGLLARGFASREPKPNVEKAPLAVLEPPAGFDSQVKPAQFFEDNPILPPPPELEDGFPSVPGEVQDAESPEPLGGLPPTDAIPLPRAEVPPPPRPNQAPRPVNPDPTLPGSKRLISITPRYGTPFQPTYRQNPDGSTTIVVRGGVQIVAEMKRTNKKKDDPETYRVDLSADNAVIWIGPKKESGSTGSLNLGGTATAQDADQPMEVYLEGDVIVRQDDLKMAGQNDQRVIRSKQAYYDFRTERLVGYDAEFDFFAPGW